MEGWDETTYGERAAGGYDDRHTEPDPACIDLLAELARGGAALELGIGTGRLALPLAQRGVDVQGIDASPAMVARLRAKPGGERVPVTMGNFADVDVAGTFRLVFVAYHTLFALLTQDEQVRCIANVAGHLEPGGAFVVEAFVPDPSRFDRGQRVEAMHVGLDEAILELSRHDPVSQRVSSQHVRLGAQGVGLQPVELRYAWPAELDLMARLAGLRLRHRWGGWRREPFTAGSQLQVAVYERD